MRNLILLLLLLLNHALAVSELYPFHNPKAAQTFSALTQNLRCLVCQNQTLADSDAPIAHDLRNEIATMLRQGENQHQILTQLHNRYGDFIFYNPPLQANTYLLWSFPFIAMVIGLAIILMLKKRIS